MLILDDPLLEALRRHGEQGYPHEVCGLLLGTASGNEHRVTAVRPVTNCNTERARDRYEMDPLESIDIEQEADAAGLQVLGCYHTHPDHPSRPSETDRQRAVDVWGDGESWSYLILSIRDGALVSHESWILRHGAFEPETIARPAGRIA